MRVAKSGAIRSAGRPAAIADDAPHAARLSGEPCVGILLCDYIPVDITRDIVAKSSLTPELLALVADRLKVLAEPARLQILSSLRNRESTVTEIVEATGLSQANVSRHLQLLHAHGFVSRRKDGLYAYYSLADQRVFKLCDLVCDSLDATVASRRRVLAS